MKSAEQTRKAFIAALLAAADAADAHAEAIIAAAHATEDLGERARLSTDLMGARGDAGRLRQTAAIYGGPTP